MQSKLKDTNNITQSETSKIYELNNCMHIHNSIPVVFMQIGEF